ncbi:hypothetical protein GCM10023083_24530 [Streptomyces phyllanthi]
MTKGLRRWLVLVWLCTVLGALAETSAILLFGDLTDNALQNGSLDAFWTPAAQWLAIAVVGAAIGYAGGSLAVWVSERFVMRLREHVFDRVQKLPPHFFQRHRQGDLLSRLTGDVEAVEQMAVSGLIGTASALFSAVFYAAAAFWLRWDLAAATFALAPLFWLAARRFSATWFRASVRSARLNQAYGQLVQVIETVCVLAAIDIGVWEISEGQMTLGQLLAFAALLGYLYPPIRSLAQLGLLVAVVTAGAERLVEVLDARPAVTDPAGRAHRETGRPDGTVEVRDVSFRYPGTGRGRTAPRRTHPKNNASTLACFCPR